MFKLGGIEYWIINNETLQRLLLFELNLVTTDLRKYFELIRKCKKDEF